ncbi:MAG: NAD(P)H-dependent glycerol-3-phosphate dehydrogenase [Clostridia bacterium]|nr:NAD(P)H-dependent glycerol-3-phosphate dehydrogenase [Clostridia bacterium]
MNMSVIGSGTWGCALCSILANKGNTVTLWSYFKEESESLSKTRKAPNLSDFVMPENVIYTSDIEQATKDMDLIVMVTPSAAIGKTAEAMSPYVKEGAVIVCASKGFDSVTQKTLTETIKDKIPNCTVAALSGPSHAEEVAMKMPTTLVAACESKSVREMIQEQFTTDYLRIYTNEDILGVEIGGALKNIIALCAGISDGLGLGDNAKAALMTRGISEIARLGAAMGAKATTFAGLSGVGDLIVTCTSMHSRNRRAGILIGKGKTCDEAMKEVNMVVEGVYATKEAYKLAKKYDVEMPITEEVYGVLFEGKPVKDTVRVLMSRSRKNEIDD